MRIITNDNYSITGGLNWMENCIKEVTYNNEVNIAVAFFTDTDSSLLKKMIDNGCYVRMVIRLNYGTDPKALMKAIKLQNLQIRFYTSRNFHPKMYIIGEDRAYIGSSNFTQSGLHRNQEINVELDSDDYDFAILNEIFDRYWEQAKVLDEATIKQFMKIIQTHPRGSEDASVFLKKEIGTNEFKNVDGGRTKSNDWKSFYDSFRRQYQEFLSAFSTLRTIYEDYGDRRFKDCPLRIEIDRFLWWIREFKAKRDSYVNVPRETDINKLKSKITPLIGEFIESDNEYLSTNAVSDYYIVAKGFSRKEDIKEMDYDELYGILLHVHAFHDQFRHFLGGKKTQKEVFMEKNPIESVKKLLIHLIFDEDDYIKRIYDCLNNPDYKISYFGDGCIKELYGIANNDEIPTRNGRIGKSMEWLGFGKV